MSIFLDSPWPAILFGIIGEAVLAVMLLRSGRGVLLGAMAGVLALSLAGVGVERLVVTDNKLIAAVIYDAAAALEANDLPRVLAHVATDDVYTREQARLVLSEVEITALKVRALDIKINRLTSPPSAKDTFNIIASGRDRRGEMGQGTRPGKLVVDLRRDPGGWIITGHQLIADPR